MYFDFKVLQDDDTHVYFKGSINDDGKYSFSVTNFPLNMIYNPNSSCHMGEHLELQQKKLNHMDILILKFSNVNLTSCSDAC